MVHAKSAAVVGSRLKPDHHDLMAQGSPTDLYLNTWCERSAANGPGTRFVLWVQGCPICCPGCFNPETHPVQPAVRIEVDALADHILAVTGIEGVTYSGGEPMTQAPALALLSQRLRSVGLTVMCYTGYTLEALRGKNDTGINSLLAQADLLIDGPFVSGLVANLLWRGSSNQRVHFLTESYRHLAGCIEGGAEVELLVDHTAFRITGTWPDGFMQRLEEILRR